MLDCVINCKVSRGRILEFSFQINKVKKQLQSNVNYELGTIFLSHCINTLLVNSNILIVYISLKTIWKLEKIIEKQVTCKVFLYFTLKYSRYSHIYH